MENKMSPIDDYLDILSRTRPAETKDFFYDRLITRLEQENTGITWVFPLKPIWMISILTVFLALNTFVLVKKEATRKQDSSSIQSFASAYDQQISSY